MTPEGLDELERLEKQATPGPWNDNGENGITQTKHLTRDVWQIPRTVDDVSFVAALRNAAPELLRLAKENQRLRDEVKRLMAGDECHISRPGEGAIECDINKKCLKCERDRLRALLQRVVPVDIVFDGPPSHESGRFVEVETMDGKSVRAGEWIERRNGTWALRLVAALASDSGGGE